MQEFRHIEHALRIHAGTDSLNQLAPELRREGLTRVMVFTGKTLAASPLLACAVEALGSLYVGTYAGVRAHTPRNGAAEAARALEEAKADAILVLGGGSAVITARAASIFLAEGCDLDAIATRRIDAKTMHSPRLSKPKLPLFILPTTPNSAYVKAGAGIFDEEAGERKAVFDPQTRAKAIFLHPDFLMSASPALVISASLDNLLLAVEGLMARQGDAISDALLIEATHLMATHLPALKQSDSPDLRLDLAMAGILAGRGTDHAPAGAVTALGHATGANHHVDNGVAKSVILPHILRFNAAFAQAGLQKLTRALGLAKSADPVTALEKEFRRIFKALELPDNLTELGVAHEAFPAIAERAMKDWFILGNARPVERAEELLAVLESAR